MRTRERVGGEGDSRGKERVQEMEKRRKREKSMRDYIKALVRALALSPAIATL